MVSERSFVCFVCAHTRIYVRVYLMEGSAVVLDRSNNNVSLESVWKRRNLEQACVAYLANRKSRSLGGHAMSSEKKQQNFLPVVEMHSVARLYLNNRMSSFPQCGEVLARSIDLFEDLLQYFAQ